MFQGEKVVVVRDARQPYHRNIDLTGPGCAPVAAILQRHRIFVGDTQALDVRDHAEHGNLKARAQKFQPRRQKRGVAAKFVDQETGDARAIGRRQQFHRAHKMREHAAAVDIADEQHRRLRLGRDVHVHDVLRGKVDLGGRARRPRL